MANFFDERVETPTTGYEETWTIGNVTGGGSTVSIISYSPPIPPYFATQGILYTGVAANNCYRATAFVAKAISYVSFDVIIASESLADNGICGLAAGLNAVSAGNWIIELVQIGGVLASLVYVADNGTLNLKSTIAWGLGWFRRFEIFWDNTNNLWQAWVDSDSIGSGSLSGTAATSDFVVLVAGNALGASTSAAVTWAEDLIICDDSARCNPGYGITQRTLGVSKLAGLGGLVN